MFKGVIRLQCVDIANAAANLHLFDEVKAKDPIRYCAEGMETIIIYVEKANDLATLQTELADAMAQAIEKFGTIDADFGMLMNGCKAVLDSKTMSHTFDMRLVKPIAPYIKVVIKDTEHPEEQ